MPVLVSSAAVAPRAQELLCDSHDLHAVTAGGGHTNTVRRGGKDEIMGFFCFCLCLLPHCAPSSMGLSVPPISSRSNTSR